MERTSLFRRAVISGTAILICLALVKFAMHLVTHNSFGYFGDELYYLAMVRHLDFGYVEVPPLVPLFMAISNFALGTSPLALHVLPALAGALTVVCCGLIAREMGGGRLAQALAALAVVAGPIWMVLDSWFAYDPFDQLITAILFYVGTVLVKKESPRRWILLGIVAGLGLMIKLSMVFTGLGFAVAILLTHHRRSLLTRWPWIALGCSVCICLPYFIWQVTHGVPLLQFWPNYARYRAHPTPGQFVGVLAILLNPVALPMLLAGLYYLSFHHAGKQFRLLAMVFWTLLIFFSLVMRTETRLFVSACFPVVAAGAVWLEKTVAGWRHNWLGVAYGVVLCVSGIVLAPAFLPILPKEQLTAALHLKSSDEIPIHFSLRIGWPEMVGQIAAIYRELPAEDRSRCVIYAGLYEEAAAIDFFGSQYGLPKAICNHVSYQTWGPGDLRGDVVLVFGKRFSDDDSQGTVPLRKLFREVTRVGMIPGLPESAVYERNLPVYLCREPIWNLKEIWKSLDYCY